MTDQEKTIEEKLEQARNRAGAYGRAYGKYSTADDRLKIILAELEEDAPEELTSVAAKASWAKRQPRYKDAVEEKLDDCAAWKTAEVYMKLLFQSAEVWRTECANERGLDRAHR